MISDNTKNFKGVGYVCYIDLLGFSKDILLNWERKKFNPLKKILTIKNRIPGFTHFNDNVDSAILGNCTYFVNSISDSITISFGYKETPGFWEIAFGLNVILRNLSYAWSTTILNGYTIRGAIDYGKIYWDQNELIGPAFIKAYHLETEVAKNSRVVISSDLNKTLKELFSQQRNTIIDGLRPKLRKDIDGYIIVNPTILYESELNKKSLIDSLKQMRDTQEGIIREKYNPLINMLSETEKITLKDSDVGHY